jgi:hypothetical protein
MSMPSWYTNRFAAVALAQLAQDIPGQLAAAELAAVETELDAAYLTFTTLTARRDALRKKQEATR